MLKVSMIGKQIINILKILKIYLKINQNVKILPSIRAITGILLLTELKLMIQIKIYKNKLHLKKLKSKLVMMTMGLNNNLIMM